MRRIILSLGAIVIVGCGPSVKLRGDIFQAKPLWEPRAAADEQRSGSDSRALEASDAPGLTYASEQVLGAGSDLTLQRAGASKRAFKGERIAAKYAHDARPFPERVARLRVTKAVVETARATCLGQTLDEVVLPAYAFREFAEEMQRASLAVYQGEAPQSRNAKIRSFAVDRELTWEGVAYAYFSAYYSGKFVDRVGGKLSKPSIGMKIPNETITSALTVGMEAIYDYILLSCAEEVRNPIVFTGKATAPKFETKDRNEPTLVNVLRHLYGQTGTEVPMVDGVLEPLLADGATTPGITRRKLQLVRTLSGYASDAGGTVADMIVRSIGGAGGAFILFGKISIGDNDTLSKLVQTGVDVTARRATEAAVAEYLYERSGAGSGPLDSLLKETAYLARSN